MSTLIHNIQDFFMADKTVPANKRETEEQEFHSPELNDDRRKSLIMTPKRSPPPPPSPQCLAVPAWSERTSPIIRCTIPGVGQKDSQSGPERKSLTQEYLETNYRKESWTLGYTDGSAENAVRNGGAGVYIQYAGGKEDKISLATGLYSTNYKAEADALKTAAAHIEASTHASPMLSSLRAPCPS